MISMSLWIQIEHFFYTFTPQYHFLHLLQRLRLKIGLHCSAECGNCRIQSCMNAESDMIEDNNADVHDDIDPADFLAEATAIVKTETETIDVETT